MPYSEELENRINQHIGDHPAITPKRMFGGVAYLLAGNMAVGIHKDSLMVRVGADAYEDAMSHPGVDVFDISGRPMQGWVLVDAGVIGDDDSLSLWIDKGMDFASSLPPK